MEVVLILILLALVFCPPKYDPAIRWKERNESKRKR